MARTQLGWATSSQSLSEGSFPCSHGRVPGCWGHGAVGSSLPALVLVAWDAD